MCIYNPDFENLNWTWGKKDKTERNASASCLDFLLSIEREVSFALPSTTHETIWTSTSQIFRSLVAISHLARPWRFISQLTWFARACSSYDWFILKAMQLSNKLFGQRYARERLKSPLSKFYGRYGIFIKQNKVSLSRKLHGILEHAHIQWLPPMIRLTLNWNLVIKLDLITKFDLFYQIPWGVDRSFSSSACQQRTLTLPEHLVLSRFWTACVLMLITLSPEFIVSSFFQYNFEHPSVFLYFA